MDNKEQSFELNNPAPAPIPQPLPHLNINRRNGGFNGVQNRFCSDVIPSPVKSTLGTSVTVDEKMENTTSYENTDEEKLQITTDSKEALSVDTPSPLENDEETTPSFTAEATDFNLKEAPNSSQDKDIAEGIEQGCPHGVYGYTSPVTSPAPDAQQNPSSVPPIATFGFSMYNAPKEKKKKKLNTPVTVLISVIVTIMVIVGVMFVYLLFSQSNSNVNWFENLFQNKTSVQKEVEKSSYKNFYSQPMEEITSEKNRYTEDHTNRSFKGINLKEQPSPKKQLTIQDNYRMISQSTVSILCFADEIKDDENLAESQGTGTIITSDGYIVTNSHVIGNSKSLYIYQVVDVNNKKYTASVVGYDSRTDIAVLKINAKNLKFASFAKTDKINVGDDVISVGDSGGIGFHNSLTKGIVSGKNRSLSKVSIDYIQIDAAVNPGNSGGPICNMYGQVIGITTVKINPVSYEGMGFAIPSETIKAIADDLIKLGYVRGRVQIGIVGLTVDDAAAQEYGIPYGISIAEILKTGSLADTKAQQGDIITELDGEAVTTFDDVFAILENHKPGDEVKIKLYRPDSRSSSKGSDFTITITLVEDKGESQNY